jgi:hypothetical protein
MPDAGTSSALRGVSWHKAERKWRAMTMVDGKNKHLGYFEVCHYMPQPLVELYGDCMVVLKVS